MKQTVNGVLQSLILTKLGRVITKFLNHPSFTAHMISTATAQPIGSPGMLHVTPRLASVTPKTTKNKSMEMTTSISIPRNGPSSSAGWNGANTPRCDSGVNLRTGRGVTVVSTCEHTVM